jgi:hypothetical protein
MLHNYIPDEDPESVLFLVPLLDFLNHSVSPNVAIVTEYDPLVEQSFLKLIALRDIGPDE